jgi:hypothetical protein
MPRSAEVLALVNDINDPGKHRENLREMMDTWFRYRDGMDGDARHSMYTTFTSLDGLLNETGKMAV